MNKVKIAALAAAAIVFVIMMIGSKNNGSESLNMEDMTEAVVAVKQINPQTVITSDMVEIKKIHNSYLIPGTISNKDQVIGMVSNTVIYSGEPVIKDKVLEQDSADSGLAVKLKPGMRALTVGIKGPSDGVAGLLKPGNFVDVICILDSDLPEDVLRRYDDLAKTYPDLYKTVKEKYHSDEADITSKAKEKKSVMLLQCKEVIAVDKIINLNDTQGIDIKSSEGYLSVTLSVLPDDALKLALGEQEGTLKLILRAQNDDGVIELKGSLVRDLLK